MEDHLQPEQLSADVLLSARSLTMEYTRGRERVRVLDDISLDLLRGETLGIVGESGCGKSTLARILLRLLEPTSGSVLYRATPHSTAVDLLTLSPAAMRQLRRSMSIVFQDPYAALNPRMTVAQILAEPFIIHHESPPEGLPTRLRTMLEEVGLDASALPRYPHAFSGGQRQRINIARALALRPQLLVLDEPVSALDVSVGAQVINLLRTMQQRHGLTCIFITHSMPLVRYLSQRILVMQRGRIVESGDTLTVCDHPRQPYTQQLIAATPEMQW